MKFFSLLQIFALIFFNSLLFATVYEDAEDGNIDGWSVYDKTPVGATISNVEDNGNRVIQLQGEGIENGYILGNWSGGNNAWKNRRETTIRWSMKYDEDFVVYVSVATIKGHRFLYYTNQNGSWRWKHYIHHGLGSDANDGTWRTFYRDLDADLKDVEPTNMIISVNAFLIRGSGLVDNIALNKDFTEPIELISSKNEKKVLMLTNHDTLTIFDTSYKNNSRIIAKYEFDEAISDIKLSKDTKKVYISTINKFQIVDIDHPHPTRAKILSSYPIDIDGISMIFTVSEDESKVYLSSYSLNFEIIDISDVENPRKLGSMSTLAYTHSTAYPIEKILIYKWGRMKYAYMRNSLGTIFVLDLSDLTEPKWVGSIGYYPH